jgi:hypothetical protein
MSGVNVFDRNPRFAKPAAREAWQESFQPVLDELRVALQARPPQRVAELAGAQWDAAASELRLCWLDRCYRIAWPEMVVFPVDCEEPALANVQGLLLYYLDRADGTPRAEEWISFRELPDGWLYHQAFQGYTGDRLVQALENDLADFVRRCKALGGMSMELGDKGYAFQVLPSVWLAVVYWQGDEEFPAQAHVLFDAAAGHYLSADGLALLGSHLVSHLLAVDSQSI